MDLPIQSRSAPSLKREQLHAHLLCEIQSGRLAAGQALPTEVTIARQLSVSRNTVRHALAELERDGLVRRIQGKGTFVTEKPREQSGPRTSSFALVVMDVVSRYYCDLFAAFERFAGDVGRSVVVCNSNSDLARQGNHVLGLLGQRAAGVVLNPTANAVTPAHHVTVLQDAGIPVVLLHRAVSEAPAPLLQLPGEQIGRMAAEKLLALGHRRVAYYDSYPTELSLSCVSGFRQILQSGGASLPEDFVNFGEMTSFSRADYRKAEAQMEGVMDRMMSSSQPPTALFVGWTEVAEWAYLVALRMGLRIPEDLSLICFGGLQNSGAIASRLTTISLDEVAAAKQAVQLLQEMNDGLRPIKQSEVIEIPLGFEAGETIAKPRNK